jgi:hypothetical protein
MMSSSPKIANVEESAGGDRLRLVRPSAIDPVALGLLAGGVAIAAAATKWTEVRGRTLEGDTPSTPVFLAVGACVALAFLAGRRAWHAAPDEKLEDLSPGAPVSGTRALTAIGLGLFSVALFAVTLILQGKKPVPLEAVAIWAASIAVAGAAFAAATPARRRVRWPRAPAAAPFSLFVLLAAGAWFRLEALGEIPAGFGGDEANQIEDAVGLLRGTDPGDPFGTGWYGTMRLGMLPAGAGALTSSDPIAGPRLPYAVVGTLSLVAAAAAGWLAAGPWGGIGTAALLALAPHHLHFSRLASVMILDALTAALFLALALSTRRTGSLLTGFFAGAVAGLALYGYAAGRSVPLLLLAAAPFLILSRPARGRRAALAFALAAGFMLAAAPNLRHAAGHFDDWNSRFNQVGIFRSEWWKPEVAKLGSPLRVLSQQFVAGTAGLLCRRTVITWYTGYPMVAPFFLPALGAAGLGYLLGRRRYLEGLLLGLLVAFNLAAVVFTDTTPAPQRLSSLFPALAILGGAALAGFLGFLPGRGEDWGIARTAVGTLCLGAAFIAGIEWAPPWSEPSPEHGGDPAALVLAASRVLPVPRYRGETVILDGQPYLDSSFPSFRYLLPATRFVNRDPELERAGRPPSGLHLIASDWAGLVPEWRDRYAIDRVIPLADPRNPRRDIGYLIRVP